MLPPELDTAQHQHSSLNAQEAELPEQHEERNNRTVTLEADARMLHMVWSSVVSANKFDGMLTCCFKEADNANYHLKHLYCFPKMADPTPSSHIWQMQVYLSCKPAPSTNG